jgi:hypothetical protein
LKEEFSGWAVDAECGYTGEGNGEEDTRQLDNRTSETGLLLQLGIGIQSKAKAAGKGRAPNTRGYGGILDIGRSAQDEEAIRMDEDEPGEDGGGGKGT